MKEHLESLAFSSALWSPKPSKGVDVEDFLCKRHICSEEEFLKPLTDPEGNEKKLVGSGLGS